jgi:hypothetical protein
VSDFDEKEYQARFLSPAATVFTASSRLPDYFARYGLERSATDVAAIEARIQAVQRFWNKLKTNPRYTKLLGALLYVNELNVSRLTLTAPKARQEYIALLQREEARAKDEVIEAIRTSLTVVAGKGFITPVEEQSLIRQWVREGPPSITERDVRGCMVGVPVREPPPPPVIPVIPEARMREYRENLGVLNFPDIWSFLGLPPRATALRVKDACEASSREWSPRPPDVRKTAAERLISMARMWASDDDAILYDNTLQMDRAREQLGPLVEVALADGQVDPQEMKRLLERAEALSISETVGRAFIARLVADRGGVIVDAAPATDTVSCKHCYRSSPLSAEHCIKADCGKALWTACACCTHRMPAIDARCRSCGFLQTDEAQARYLASIARVALEAGELGTAKRLLADLQRLWGRRPDVEALFLEAEKQEQQIQAAWREAETALERHELRAAQAGMRKVLAQDPEFAPPGRKPADERLLEVERHLARIEDLIAEAQAAAGQGRFDDAHAKLQHVARQAKDVPLPPLLCPPQPARDVVATFHQDHVAVVWEPTTSGGPIEYVVVRQEGRAPVSPTDGTEVGRQRGCGLVDRQMRPGATCIYAVFALREGAAAPPAVSPPLHVVAEVGSLTLVVGDGEVTGSWEHPAGGVVQVRRQLGAPPDAGAGEAVEVTFRTFFDSGLRNGDTYGYRVSVAYTLPDGSIVTTPGVTATARPQAPPRPVRDLSLAAAADGGLTLAWTPPPGGVVALHRLARAPRWAVGTSLSTSEVAALGAPLSARAGAASWTDPTPVPGVSYYMPVTVVGDVAVVGQAVEYVAIPDVTALEVEDFQSYMQLRWVWPEGCRLVVVAWRPDGTPASADDPLAQRLSCTRGEYDALGGLRIEQPVDAPHHIKVFAAAMLDGVIRHSTGVGSSCTAEARMHRRGVIRYRISRGWFRRRTLTITLESDTHVEAAPACVLVAKRGLDRPLDAEDGTVVETLPSLTLYPRQPHTLRVDLSGLVGPFCVRLFFRDRAGYDAYRLEEPRTSEMKVS